MGYNHRKPAWKLLHVHLVVFFDFSFYFEGGIFIVLLWRSKYVVCFSFKNSILRNTGFAVSPSCYLIRFQVIYRVKVTHMHTHTHQTSPELQILQGTSEWNAPPFPSGSPFPFVPVPSLNPWQAEGLQQSPFMALPGRFRLLSLPNGPFPGLL